MIEVWVELAAARREHLSTLSLGVTLCGALLSDSGLRSILTGWSAWIRRFGFEPTHLRPESADAPFTSQTFRLARGYEVEPRSDVGKCAHSVGACLTSLATGDLAVRLT